MMKNPFQFTGAFVWTSQALTFDEIDRVRQMHRPLTFIDR